MSRAALAEKLRREPNVCGGGTGIAIVYCCARSCPYRDLMLCKLGLPHVKYFEVKNRVARKWNAFSKQVCFRNLAYCCSPDKPCPRRDAALRELGWTIDDYLNFKAEILEEYMREIPELTLEKLESTRVVYACLAVLYLDTRGMAKPEKKMYYATGFVSPELGIGQLSVLRSSDEQAETKIGILEGDILPVYISSLELLQRLRDFLAKTKKSLSEVVEEALAEYLAKHSYT